MANRLKMYPEKFLILSLRFNWYLIICTLWKFHGIYFITRWADIIRKEYDQRNLWWRVHNQDFLRVHFWADLQPTTDRVAQNLQIISQKIQFDTRSTRILMGFIIYYLVLIVNPMGRILVRWKVLKTISRFSAILSAIGCTIWQGRLTCLIQ